MSLPAVSEQVLISSGDQVAYIGTVGAALCRYRVGEDDLVGSYAEDVGSPQRFWGATLAPWPNRLAGARYEFNGQSYELPITEPTTGHALHGLLWQRHWSVQSRTSSSVRLRRWLGRDRGYPFDVQVAVEYSVGPDGLSVRVDALNAGPRPAPWGYGAHPYVLCAPPLADVLLQVPAARRLESDPWGIPVGAGAVDGSDDDFRAGVALGDRPRDMCLTDLSRDTAGDAVVTVRACPFGIASAGPRDVQIRLGAGLDYVHLFTAPAVAGRPAAVAIEPMSCAPDGFHSGAGLVALSPGRSWTASWGVRVLD